MGLVSLGGLYIVTCTDHQETELHVIKTALMRIAATMEILLSMYPSLSIKKSYHDAHFNLIFCFAARREDIDAIKSYLKASASKLTVTL